MSEITLYNRCSWDFWRQCRDLSPVHRDIILEALTLLDSSLNYSVMTEYPTTGPYDPEKWPMLLEHSIQVATSARALTRGHTFEGLATIAGLCHDIAKLPELHPGRYSELMHTFWGAEYVRGLVQGRLIAIQERTVVQAVKYHHLCDDSAVSRAVKKADEDCRNTEEWAQQGRDQRRSL